jgi:hypothetical protein
VKEEEEEADITDDAYYGPTFFNRSPKNDFDTVTIAIFSSGAEI